MRELCRRTVLHCLPAIAAGLGLGFLAAPAPAAAEELTLKAALFVPPTTTYGVPFKRFVDHVNETGKGVLQIRIVGGPEAVPADGQAQAVKSGVLDIASIPTAYYKSLMVEGDAQVLNNLSVAQQRSSGLYEMLNQLAIQKVNATYLTTYGVGVHFHFYVTKDMAVTKPDDLKGLRFRGQPNYAAMFKHYGMSGVNIAAPEVYTALERGTVQGYGWPLWGIEDFGWDKLTKIRIDPGFYNVTVNVLMNKPRYDGLTPAQRKVLDDAVVWFEKDDLRYTEEKTKQTLEAQAKAGIKTVDFGPEWQKTAVELSWEDLTKLSPESIGKLRAVIDKAEKK
jgi:TRAP-type C4-dicarboxylate transport system substrate-binding protein